MQHQIDNAEKQWWKWVQQGVLHIQRCEACAARQHPPGPICRSCRSTEHLGWSPHEGPARVVSKTEVQQTIYPAYRDLVPYWILLVDLGHGAHTLALLGPDATRAPELGDEGEIGFMQVQDVKVLVFEARETHG